MVNLVRHAIVVGNSVVNIVDYTDIKNGSVEGIEGIAIVSDTAQIGDSYIDNSFIAAEKTKLPDPPVSAVRRVQALKALASIAGNTSTLYEEVLAWVAVQSIEVQIDFNNQEVFKITDPNIQTFKNLKGWTDQQLQDLFTFADTF